MRAIGRGSISSILKITVDVAWVIACALLGFIWIIAILSLIAMLRGQGMIPGFEIEISRPNEVIVWTLNGTVLAVSAMIVCSYLRGIFETLVAGDPFVPDNARRLRSIALVVAVMEIARLTIAIVVQVALNALGVTPDDGTQHFITPNLSVWFSVLTLFVLAQVFREGAAMREEQKMTI
ncbi:MAG: DUF2975 domain-containing protein [Hyphomonadaceae bacterium]